MGGSVEAVNLDPEEPEIPWSRAVGQLDKLEPRGGSRGPTCWLTTTRADGRPHVAGVVGFWADGTLYFRQWPPHNEGAEHCPRFAVQFRHLTSRPRPRVRRQCLPCHRCRDARPSSASLRGSRLAARGRGRHGHSFLRGTDRAASAMASPCLQGSHGSRRCHPSARWSHALAFLVATRSRGTASGSAAAFLHS